MDWHVEVLQAFIERDRNELAPYKSMCRHMDTVMNAYNTSETERIELTQKLNSTTLQKDDLAAQLVTRMKSTVEDGQAAARAQELEENVRDLERKLRSAQEQLTEEVSGRAVRAERALSLSEEVQQHQDTIKALELSMEEMKASLDATQEESRQHRCTIESQDSQIAILTEELDKVKAERDELASVKKKLKEENDMLVERWMRKSLEDADKLNQINEMYSEVLEARKAGTVLQDAEQAFAGVVIGQGAFNSGVCGEISIPRSQKYILTGHGSEVNNVTYNFMGSTLATCSNDDTIRTWDGKTGTALARLQPAPQQTMAVAFSPSNEHLLTAGTDKCARIFNVAQSRVVHTLTGHTEKIYAAACVADFKSCVTGSYDRTLKFWDTDRGYATKTVICYSSCNDVAVNPDGSMLASGHLDRSLRIWHARTGQLIKDIEEMHSHTISSVTFSSDGTLILTNSRDSCLRLIDVRTYGVVKTFSDDRYRSNLNYNRASISPDGQYVVAGSNNSDVLVWNALNGRRERLLTPDTSDLGAVTACAWSPNGVQVASSYRGRRVILWE